MPNADLENIFLENPTIFLKKIGKSPSVHSFLLKSMDTIYHCSIYEVYCSDLNMSYLNMSIDNSTSLCVANDISIEFSGEYFYPNFMINSVQMDHDLYEIVKETKVYHIKDLKKITFNERILLLRGEDDYGVPLMYLENHDE